MAGLGHNNGPTMERGRTWRKTAWRKARADLLPTLPVEVVRIRVKRAKALGLPYKTYAGIRASTGHDLVGFLFSSNALGVYKPDQSIPAEVSDKLSQLQACLRVGLAYPRIDLSAIAELDFFDAAPDPHLAWSDMRDRLKATIQKTGKPADRFLMIGDTGGERDWAEAGQTAGYLAAHHYFTQRSAL